MKKSFYLFIGLLLFGGLILSGCDFGNNNQQPAPIEDDPTALTLTFYDGETLIAKQTYHKGEEISYPTEPAKEGQFFVGWVDDSGHLFELEIMPSTSVVLHTKYEAGYTYYFVDYDGTILKKGNGPVGSTVLEPNAPTRAKEGTTVYTFVGWDKEVTALMDNVTYTAVYESKEVAVLTMHLDGGNFQYRDYDDVTTALLNDYNRFSGKQYTKGSLPTGAYECANFASFYYNGIDV